tara:strand:+ start:3258 stop:3848 length:591 start_codon:yes stop_codon:yes gene_type:complete
MGYTTDFKGSFELDKPLTEEQKHYYNNWKSLRRVKRDSDKLNDKYEGKYGLEGDYGIEGEYFGYIPEEFSDKDGNFDWSKEGSTEWINNFPNPDDSIIDDNHPPSTQPGLWCQWEIEDDKLVWDGGEKFYNYKEWLDYIIKNFLNTWGVKLNGEVYWSGEECMDTGTLVVRDNHLLTYDGHVQSYDVEEDFVEYQS